MVQVPVVRRGPTTGRTHMTNVEDKSKANIRLAVILGVVAFGFFLLGLYLSTGKGG